MSLGSPGSQAQTQQPWCSCWGGKRAPSTSRSLIKDLPFKIILLYSPTEWLVFSLLHGKTGRQREDAACKKQIIYYSLTLLFFSAVFSRSSSIFVMVQLDESLIFSHLNDWRSVICRLWAFWSCICSFFFSCCSESSAQLCTSLCPCG